MNKEDVVFECENIIKNELKKVINTNIPVLITGETGTGKEVFADAIHASSIRKDGPYV